jgi:molybdopterin/thiamine biosynthesis adenylyltransferase
VLLDHADGRAHHARELEDGDAGSERVRGKRRAQVVDACRFATLIAYAADARRVADADFAFLATDSILSRYAFNLICHQYLVPGVQVGAKVSADAQGSVSLVHVMERPLTFSGACLDCMGVIPAETSPTSS